jgi:hypothetical protein
LTGAMSTAMADRNFWVAAASSVWKLRSIIDRPYVDFVGVSSL